MNWEAVNTMGHRLREVGFWSAIPEHVGMAAWASVEVQINPWVHTIASRIHDQGRDDTGTHHGS